jgi:hypothetical protein
MSDIFYILTIYSVNVVCFVDIELFLKFVAQYFVMFMPPDMFH